MGGLFGSIGYNFGNLARFSGRDTRAQFWPYAIFLFVLGMIIAFVFVATLMADMFVRIQRYAIEHPEGPPIDDKDPFAQPVWPPELIPDFGSIMLPMQLVNLATTLLIAAAVARRLHDRDMSALWGLMPLPFWAIGVLIGPNVVGAGFDPTNPPDPSLFMLSTLSGLAMFAVLVGLIVLLAGEGSRGPNRFGPEPSAPR